MSGTRTAGYSNPTVIMTIPVLQPTGYGTLGESLGLSSPLCQVGRWDKSGPKKHKAQFWPYDLTGDPDTLCSSAGNQVTQPQLPSCGISGLRPG